MEETTIPTSTNRFTSCYNLPVNTEPTQVQCPYCGEMIEIQVDPSAGAQNYIEDCSVCCRPIQFDITPGEDGPDVSASRSE